MRAVNLLPADAQTSARSFTFGAGLSVRRALQVGGVVTVLVAALFVALFFHERSIVHSKQARLDTDNRRLVAVQPQADAVRAAQTEAQTRVNAVRVVVESRMNWDRTMTDLAKYLPTDVYLTSMQVTSPVSAAVAGAASVTDTPPPPAPSLITITGVASSYVRVAAVLDRLALVPWMSSVLLQSTSRDTTGKTTFAVQATVGEVH
jgi:Tfp pilus assembly protein PilN